MTTPASRREPLALPSTLEVTCDAQIVIPFGSPGHTVLRVVNHAEGVLVVNTNGAVHAWLHDPVTMRTVGSPRWMTTAGRHFELAPDVVVEVPMTIWTLSTGTGGHEYVAPGRWVARGVLDVVTRDDFFGDAPHEWRHYYTPLIPVIVAEP